MPFSFLLRNASHIPSVGRQKIFSLFTFCSISFLCVFFLAQFFFRFSLFVLLSFPVACWLLLDLGKWTLFSSATKTEFHKYKSPRHCPHDRNHTDWFILNCVASSKISSGLVVASEFYFPISANLVGWREGGGGQTIGKENKATEVMVRGGGMIGERKLESGSKDERKWREDFLLGERMQPRKNALDRDDQNGYTKSGINSSLWDI